MRHRILLIGLKSALAIFFGFQFVISAWAGSQETVLHNFRPSPVPPRFLAGRIDGYEPFYGNLAVDASGNFYGITSEGGIFGYGTVFKVTRTGNGWTESLLYNFGHTRAEGIYPEGGLILDAAGNVYGTAKSGGDNNSGLVFELVHNSDGTWTEKVLHSFNGTDGFGPYATLIFDAAGNIYGTTLGGGAYNYGAAFELTPTGGGNWSEKVLYSFGNGTDGQEPLAPLVFDPAGNLYGTTAHGGAYAYGIAFELTPSGGGTWTEKVLHSFGSSGGDGQEPFAGALVLDSSGNLYGTTQTGGAHLCENGSVGCGTVYELTPTGGGSWSEQVLYSFNNNGDGYIPTCSLLFDTAGNLYGTTYFGGLSGGGTVFKLTQSNGWTEQVLYNFGAGTDGVNPGPGLISDGAGNLYGTTLAGGVFEGGMAFEITP